MGSVWTYTIFNPTPIHESSQYYPPSTLCVTSSLLTLREQYLNETYDQTLVACEYFLFLKAKFYSSEIKRNTSLHLVSR